MLNSVRNQGKFMYNIEILKNGRTSDELVIARRPEQGKHKASDHLPCKYCLKFFKGDLWRHCRCCQFLNSPLHQISNEPSKTHNSYVSGGQLLLQGAGVTLKIVIKRADKTSSIILWIV